MIKEMQRNCTSGYFALVVLPVLLIADGWWFFNAVTMVSV